MPAPAHRSAFAVLLIRAGIVFLAIVTAFATWKNLERFPRTEDAEIRANVVGIAPQVGGSIVRLHVTDNQKVNRGDLLFEIDARPYEAEAARAGIRRHENETELGGVAQGICLHHEGLFSAGEAREEVERRKRPRRGVRRHEDRELHLAAGLRRGMAVEADRPAEAGLLASCRHNGHCLTRVGRPLEYRKRRCPHNARRFCR